MADRFKNIAKNGWHPEKNRSSGSGTAGDSKLGQVVGHVPHLRRTALIAVERMGRQRLRQRLPR